MPKHIFRKITGDRNTCSAWLFKLVGVYLHAKTAPADRPQSPAISKPERLARQIVAQQETPVVALDKPRPRPHGRLSPRNTPGPRRHVRTSASESTCGESPSTLERCQSLGRSARGFANWIVSALAPWIASHDPPETLQHTAKNTVSLDGFYEIFATGRRETAPAPDQARQRRLVASHQRDHRPAGSG